MQSRLLLLGAPGGLGDVASRRMRLLLQQVLRGRPGGDRQRLEVRLMHAGVTDSGETVNIGDVSYKLKTPKNPELVPQNMSRGQGPQFLGKSMAKKKGYILS